MYLQKIIEKHWYFKTNLFLTLILLPFSIIYKLIIYTRNLLFKLNLKKSYQLPIPVVIVGNISVGGAGKTPLTKYLVQRLIKDNYKVGIILRGYKGTITSPHIVTPLNNNSQEVGDEAMIYVQNGFKVAIGSDRYQAGKLLIDNFPDLQIIIADDGMQHYKLKRDYEICVVDSSRIFGNCHVLPMGPLREPINRINSVDHIVINGKLNENDLNLLKEFNKNLTYQNLQLEVIINPFSNKQVTSDYFNKIPTKAIAAIGNPERFFNYLIDLNINLTATQAYPDHYYYQNTDIDSNYAIITTEKDYTKLSKFDTGNIWVIKVAAKLNNEVLIKEIEALIK